MGTTLVARSVQHSVREPISIDARQERNQADNRIHFRTYGEGFLGLFSLSTDLFSDAEATENAVENVVGVDRAENQAEFVEG